MKVKRNSIGVQPSHSPNSAVAKFLTSQCSAVGCIPALHHRNLGFAHPRFFYTSDALPSGRSCSSSPSWRTVVFSMASAVLYLESLLLHLGYPAEALTTFTSQTKFGTCRSLEILSTALYYARTRASAPRWSGFAGMTIKYCEHSCRNLHLRYLRMYANSF